MFRGLKFLLAIGMGVLASAFWRGSAPADNPPDPQIFYSDWVSDQEMIPAWSNVSSSDQKRVAWLKYIFEREGVPSELVWVAAVESSFDESACSSRGAVGLFQIMPDTAMRYGLTTSQPDERLEPHKNAEVAARYLADLYARFNTWPLAVAAFNAGEGRVARAIRFRTNPRYENIAAKLPAETRSYVPRVLAMISFREGTDARALPSPVRRHGTLAVADVDWPVTAWSR